MDATVKEILEKYDKNVVERIENDHKSGPYNLEAINNAYIKELDKWVSIKIEEKRTNPSRKNEIEKEISELKRTMRYAKEAINRDKNNM